MVTILNTFLEHSPSLKLIGKRYSDQDRDQNGSFGEKWGQWHRNGWFDAVENGVGGYGDAYVGAMRFTDAGFEYWIGVLMPADHPVPPGFEAERISAGDLAVSYLYGRDGTADLFGIEAHEACVAEWRSKGWVPKGWYLERYNCPRYVSPDEKGNVILDYCAYI